MAAFVKYTAKNVRKIIKGFCRAMDILPNGYKIVSGWLYKDAQERIAENCLTYEMLVYSSQKLEYKITHCMYVEVFERYGVTVQLEQLKNRQVSKKMMFILLGKEIPNGKM